MGNRYDNREIFQNNNETYDEILEERNVPFIRQYGTPQMSRPTAAQISSFSLINHIWVVGDRYYKLAIKYYGDAQYWWVIALYNGKPTEASIRVGDMITIPLPLERVLRSVRV